jgi:hypothetical protein
VCGSVGGRCFGDKVKLGDKRKDFGTRGCEASYLYANPKEATSARAMALHSVITDSYQYYPAAYI